jgi:hypothetical protein
MVSLDPGRDAFGIIRPAENADPTLAVPDDALTVGIVKAKNSGLVRAQRIPHHAVGAVAETVHALTL